MPGGIGERLGGDTYEGRRAVLRKPDVRNSVERQLNIASLALPIHPAELADLTISADKSATSMKQNYN